MTVREFCALCVEKATAAGISPAEAYGVKSESFKAKVFDQKIDDYSVSSTQGVSLRGLWQGKQGMAFTELLTAEAVDELILAVKDAASVIDSQDEQPYTEGGQTYRQISARSAALGEITPEQKIDLARRAERAAKEADSRVKQCDWCLTASGDVEFALSSSLGIDLQSGANEMELVVSVVLEDNGRMYTGFEVQSGRKFADFDPEAAGRKAAGRAAARVGAEPCATGTYDVVLDAEVVASLLGAFSSAFSGEAAQRGLSCLKDSLGKQVAASIVTVVDDPFRADSPSSRGFDGEGVPTANATLIDKGSLAMFLHNQKSAKKAGVAPTGHGARPSYKGGVSISPSNLVLQPGSSTLDELLSQMKDGLYITEMSGMHAGLSPISGDFSLLSAGFIVKDGKLSKPIERITLAGSLVSLLTSVQAIGSDVYSTTRSYSLHTPSLLIKGVSVAGV